MEYPPGARGESTVPSAAQGPMLRRISKAAAAVAIVGVGLLVLGDGTRTAVAPTYRDAVLADAPVGYWRLGETSGPAADESSSAVAGTYQGGVVRGVAGALSGDPDAAARFDGVDDLVSMGDPPSGVLDFGTGDFTAEAWIKTTVNGERAILGKRTSSRYWQVTVTDDVGFEGRLRATIRGSKTRQAYSAVRVDDGLWHHV